MRFLYACFISNSMQYSGILKKVAGQTNGAAQLGYEAEYTYVDEESVTLSTGAGLIRKPLPPGLRWRAQKQAITDKICEFIAAGNYDVVYIKGFLTSPYDLQIAKSAKAAKKTCRVIFEIATYPYRGEYRRFLKADMRARNLRSLAGHMLEIFQHGITVPRIKKQVDVLAVFGAPVKKVWGIPAINVDNGVSVDKIDLRRSTSPAAGADIALLGVIGTSIAHGYSRILDGLAAYEKSRSSTDPQISFNIVGQNETIAELKAQAANLQITEKVHFLGYKNSDELAKLYDDNDSAVSCLGEYKVGLTHLSPIKSREYCAAGVPFLYAYEDSLLNAETSFALKFSNDATPIDMNTVVDFVQRCRKDPSIAKQERLFAEQNYDWKIIMKQVLDFAASAQK